MATGSRTGVLWSLSTVCRNIDLCSSLLISAIVSGDSGIAVAQRPALEVGAVLTREQSMKDCIGCGRVAQPCVPVLYVQLGGEDSGACAVASPVIQDQYFGARRSSEPGVEAAVAVQDAQLFGQTWHAQIQGRVVAPAGVLRESAAPRQRSEFNHLAAPQDAIAATRSVSLIHVPLASLKRQWNFRLREWREWRYTTSSPSRSLMDDRGRVAKRCETGWEVVAKGGIEPPTRGFSIRCSTN